jgi:ABC-type branched-subunit amino acid transport system ATPase component
MVGGLQAVRLGTVEPYGAFSLTWTINIVSTTIVGGIGTIVGPVIGAGFTTWLGEALSGYPEIHVAITGVIVILIIRFAPAGIWGIVVSLYRRLAVQRLGGHAEEGVRTEEHAHAASLAADGPRLTPSGEAGAVMLKTDAITKRYGDVVAVSEVSIEVRRGEVLGIIGPNGAGKSTVVGMLSGALNADGGTVAYEGSDVTHMPAYKRARMGIGRTHQIPRPFRQMTVFENLLVARHYGGRSESDLGVHADCEAILHDLGLSSVAHKKAADLTLLQLKRLELARALALEPRILLMDEIGAGLVESEILELIEVIKALRHRVEAIVIIEHIMDVITECCDRVAVLDFGRLIADGPVQKVLSEPEVVSCYLGTGCEVAKPRVEARTVELDARAMRTLDGVAAGTGTSRRSPASASRCTAARSSRCSAPTAPARRLPRASSAA